MTDLRVIPGFSLYSAGSDGRLYRWLTGSKRDRGSRPGRWKPIKGYANGTARLVGDDGRKVTTSVARQVLRAWVGPAPIGCEPLRYPDPDPGNNRPDNLRWAPRGSSKVGDPRLSEAGRRATPSNRAFTDEEVAEILRMAAQGVTSTEIAEREGVSRVTIGHILKGRRYQHIPRPDALAAALARNRLPRGTGHHKAVLTPGKARKIRRLRERGKSHRDIADEIGCSPTTVKRVLDGETWLDDAARKAIGG